MMSKPPKPLSPLRHPLLLRPLSFFAWLLPLSALCFLWWVGLSCSPVGRYEPRDSAPPADGAPLPDNSPPQDTPPPEQKVCQEPPSKLLHTMKGHSGNVYGVAYSPDGLLLASTGEDATLRLWYPHSGLAYRSLAGHSGAVYAVAFFPDGAKVVTAGKDTTVRIWDVYTKRQLLSLTGHRDEAMSVAVSPDGKWIASGDRNTEIIIWTSGGLPKHRLRSHSSAITGLAFSPDSRTLASAGSELNLWDVQRGTLLKTLAPSEVKSIAYHPQKGYLAAGYYQKLIKLWDPASGKETLTLTGHTWAINSLAFSRDGRWLGSGSSDKYARLWDPATGKLLKILYGHINWIHSVAFHPKGTYFITASRDKIRVWTCP